MSCWPKDKIPKRNSSGDRWREHQLVSLNPKTLRNDTSSILIHQMRLALFLIFILNNLSTWTGRQSKWHVTIINTSRTWFDFYPVSYFWLCQAFQLPRQDLALAYCRYVEPQNHTSYQDFVAARNDIALDIAYVKETNTRALVGFFRYVIIYFDISRFDMMANFEIAVLWKKKELTDSKKSSE